MALLKCMHVDTTKHNETPVGKCVCVCVREREKERESKRSLIRRWSPSWDGGKLTKGCCRKLKGDERWAVSGFLVCLLLL